MTGNLSLLCGLRDVIGCPVRLPDGKQLMANKEGTVTLDGGLKVENVLYVPTLSCNLLSISQLTNETNCVVYFTNNLCVMQDCTSKMLIGVGEQRDGLYFFKGIRSEKAHKANGTCELNLWHQRMGHPSFKVTKLASNMRCDNSILKNKPCDVCLRAKQTRDVFPLSTNNASDSFELIHCDLWGPYRTPSSCGASYFLTIMDDFSRAIWIYLISDKREVSRTLLNFFALIERQFGKQIKVLRSDNGTEFTCLRNYFHEHGIVFQTSCPGTPQQNGRVERKHRHILNVARALRFQGNLPISFWGECVLTAGYLINRTPTPVLSGKTPYEMLYGQAPMYEHLKVFGCLCYAHNLDRHGDKFASRSRKCIFVGYPYGKKGWKLFDLDTQCYFVSRDVEFFETEFPFTPTAGVKYDLSVDSSLMNDTLDNDDDNDLDNDTRMGENTLNEVVVGSEVREGTVALDSERSDELVEEGNNPTPNVDSLELVRQSSLEELGRGHRTKLPSVKLREYVTHTIKKLSPSPSQSTSQYSSGTPYPISHYISCENFSEKHCRFVVKGNSKRPSEVSDEMLWVVKNK
uniref:Retrovirus-related Pol polyprotein from transposon TNT 1-94 n=1 Tax=Cajanus cajan TaxID=3821 RepID=A0A151T9M0_CAJCA|nr:Retrovirus-related Pol polyprotein from transposon TNT 1-94 [Cajanus cajan]